MRARLRVCVRARVSIRTSGVSRVHPVLQCGPISSADRPAYIQRLDAYIQYIRVSSVYRVYSSSQYVLIVHIPIVSMSAYSVSMPSRASGASHVVRRGRGREAIGRRPVASPAQDHEKARKGFSIASRVRIFSWSSARRSGGALWRRHKASPRAARRGAARRRAARGGLQERRFYGKGGLQAVYRKSVEALFDPPTRINVRVSLCESDCPSLPSESARPSEPAFRTCGCVWRARARVFRFRRRRLGAQMTGVGGGGGGSGGGGGPRGVMEINARPVEQAEK